MSQACNSARNANISFVFNGQQTASGAPPGNSCVLPTPSSVTETRDCPTGQIGQIVVERTASCTGPATPSNLAVWSDWEEISNTCVNICVPHSPSTEKITEACAAGYIGNIVRTRTSSCPNGPNSAGAPVWSGWTVTENCVAACEPLSPEQRTVACPTGWSGIHTQGRTSTCPKSTGSPEWGPWTTIKNECEEPPRCVVPNPATQLTWQNFSNSCPDTHVGTISMRRQMSSTASCSNIYAPSPTWSTPTPTGVEETVGNPAQACTPKCTPSSREEWRREAGPACPVNQVGETTRERRWTQTSTCVSNVERWPDQWSSTSQTRNPVSNCRPSPCSTTGRMTWSMGTGQPTCESPAISLTLVERGQKMVFEAVPTHTNANKGTATYVCNTLPDGSSSLVLDTTVNTNKCEGPCTAPAPQTETDNRTNTQTLACSSGYTGQITQQRAETRTRSRSATCSSTHGNPTWGNWSAWSAWTGGAWTTTSNTCVIICVVPNPSTEVNRETRTGTQTLSCPVNQNGGITQTRPEERTRTRSASCPAPTGNPVWSGWSGWSAWTATGAWTTTSNTCRWNAPTCVVPANQVVAETTTSSRNANCPSTVFDGFLVQHQPLRRTRTRTATCPDPYGQPVWNEGTWSGWVAQSDWVTVDNRCTVPACSGNFTNNARHYLARYPDLLAAFGTNYNAAQSHWNTNGYFEGRQSCWGAPPATCSVPAPQTEANVWYEQANAGCPAGQTGQHMMQRAITDHRVRTASCPNPYGAPVWGGWGGWYRVAEGPWTTVSNTCVAACQPRQTTQSQSIFCTGTQTTVVPGIQTRTAYWTCPGPTITSYSNWVRQSSPQCCPRGQQCSIQ